MTCETSENDHRYRWKKFHFHILYSSIFWSFKEGVSPTLFSLRNGTLSFYIFSLRLRLQINQIKNNTQKSRKDTRMVLALQTRWLIILFSFKTTMIRSSNFNLSLLKGRLISITTLAPSDSTYFSTKKRSSQIRGRQFISESKTGTCRFYFSDKLFQSSF